MSWSWLWKLLLPIFGEVLMRFVVPMLDRQVKGTLETVLPVAERWVAAMETTGMSGLEKQLAAVREITEELRRDGITDISRGVIDTGIQMAWVKLGLYQK